MDFSWDQGQAWVRDPRIPFRMTVKVSASRWKIQDRSSLATIPRALAKETAENTPTPNHRNRTGALENMM